MHLRVLFAIGSSPRTRGTVSITVSEGVSIRFIPADAGNRQSYDISAVKLFIGSSPRTRGTESPDSGVGANERFIPADAGNRLCEGKGSPQNAVHPRGRGEQPLQALPIRPSNGSSPRTRGTGNPSRWGRLDNRFIPADAGNSHPGHQGRDRPAVHPRGRGEQGVGYVERRGEFGSSPRTRGTVTEAEEDGTVTRFIPADAGNRSFQS